MTEPLGLSGASAEAAIMAAMNDTPPPITKQEVKARYMTDPTFAARVNLAVGEMERDHQVRFDAHDLSLVQEAAGWALLVAERFP